MARARGFSLVELMVTLAIVAVLGLLAVPFTAAWVQGSRQEEVRGALAQAVGQARALALRNPAGLPPGAPAACVRRAAAALEVVQPAAAQDCAAAPVVWRTPLDAGVGLHDATGAAFACVAFDSRGQPADPAQAPACTLATRLSVAGRDPEDAIDVDLL